MQTLWQDLRYGVRMLLKHPGFTLTAVVTLALGIGANTAIFSVVNAVLLRPLPYPESERLMWIGQQFPYGLSAAGEPKFLFWREQSESFEAMTILSGFGGGGNLAGGNEPEYVEGVRVSADFFRVFRVQPAAGRAFTKEEDLPRGERVAILSDGLWRRRFGADAGLIGKTIVLNDQSVTVIGVMPPHFQLRRKADLFTPMRPSLQGDPNPNATVVGRLKPGVTEAQARAELKLIAEKYRAANPNWMIKGETVGLQPYHELFTMNVQQLLWILLGAVGFLLLIACANVANLQLTRAAARQKEMAVRMALGAGGRRIVRQLLTEGVLLALAGGSVGLLLAVWGTDLLVAAVPENIISRPSEVSFDWRVLAFAFSAAIGTGVLFGLAPGLQAARVDVNASLKEGAGKGAGGAARGRLRGALVVIEVALSLVLLVGSMLLIRTFANLRGVAPGFDPRNVLTFQVALNGERYDTTHEAAAFYRDALQRIRSVPGVEAAAVTNVLPLEAQFRTGIYFTDRPNDPRMAQFRIITPEYFRVMKIAVQQGRAFTESDNAGAQSVAIVNEAFVRSYLGGMNPFEQQLTVGRTVDDLPRRIVGVVADQKQFSLASQAPPMVFVPITQTPDRLMRSVRRFVAAYITVRTTVEPLSLSAAMKWGVCKLKLTVTNNLRERSLWSAGARYRFGSPLAAPDDREQPTQCAWFRHFVEATADYQSGTELPHSTGFADLIYASVK